MRKSHTLDDVEDMLELRVIALEEVPSSRRIVEKILDHDGCPGGIRIEDELRPAPSFHVYFHTDVSLGLPCPHLDLGHSCGRRQRLSAEPERAYLLQVLVR